VMSQGKNDVCTPKERQLDTNGTDVWAVMMKMKEQEAKDVESRIEMMSRSESEETMLHREQEI
jgi:hypothetical protein